MAIKPTFTVDELQSKLTQDEEWLKELEDGLKKNSALTTSVCTILDDFKDRIKYLSNTVNSLYNKTSVVQQEQQNVKKLLSIVDATIQFHGKTMDFENTIRDGNLLHDLPEYLEKMNNLKEAISFFSSHTTYKSQLDHMLGIYETGCGYLETEFGNLIKSRSIVMDPAKIFECLDEEYEMPNFSLSTLTTIKDIQKLSQMANWLLANTTCTHFLNYYATNRSENLIKTQKIISDQFSPLFSSSSNTASRTSKTHFIKSAFKKAASKIGDKSSDANDLLQKNQDNAVSIALFMLSTTLILIQLETKVCATIFSNTTVEANILRQTINAPLINVTSYIFRIAEFFEGSFEALLPLIKFFMKHSNQIQSLCENIGEACLFLKIKSAIKTQSVQRISDFIDRLTNDHNRFVPADGNVHHVTSSTLNFLKLLTQNRPVIGYIYEDNNTSQNTKMNISKLFAQMLSALDVNLRNKSSTYSDSTLGALFMFNNLSYISICCSKDKNLMSILDSSNGQVLSFYQSEIDKYLNRYIQTWSKITAIFDDKRSAKFVYSSFNKEFDSLIDLQKNYCLVDLSLAHNIRKRIKEIVLKPYVEFNSRNSYDCAETDTDRQQLKYDAESIGLIIDRLFDISY